MDIQLPPDPRKRTKRMAMYAAGGVALLLVVLGLARMKPGAPGVDRSALWIDTVKRGPMVREVRGTGTLVPEDIRWISATSSGTVERIVLRPGRTLQAGEVILELTNPQLQQELQDAEFKLSAAEAGLKNLRAQLENEYLQMQASAAAVEAEYRKALLQADVNEQMAKDHLVSDFALRQSRLDADQLAIRNDISRKQLVSNRDSMPARIAVQQSDVDQARAIVSLKRRQASDLHVRAGFPGVLQLVPVEVGQQVSPGTNLARVANPSLLKAEVKIPETQAKDIQIGQSASVDTRNGLIGGRVVRVDPSVQNGTVTVDISLEGTLPKGARPDLSVDGTIELERLTNVLYVGVPAVAQEQSSTNLFRVGADGIAIRVQVKLGRASVNAIEVLSGLNAGDQVILSDTSAVGGYERIRLQ